jgi:carbonic anhydrase
VAAVVDEPAVTAPDGERTRSELAEPCLERRRSPQRVDQELPLEAAPLSGPSAGDAHGAVRSLTDQTCDTDTVLERDVRLVLDCRSQRALEDRPPDAERHQVVVARLPGAGEQLELAVLERTVAHDAVEHVRSLGDQRPAGETEEVVRLAEVRHPGSLPAVEHEVGPPGEPAVRIALEHADTSSPSREAERCGQPGETGTEDDDVGASRLLHRAIMRLAGEAHKPASALAPDPESSSLGRMAELDDLFARNRAWAAAMVADDPAFFAKLVERQTPDYLWIGCSDSRVPANQIVGLAPGDVFVHRNVANVVVHTDLNALSVLQYAVDILRVRHVIVCGHYGCGGVDAAYAGARHGLIDNWLRHVADVAERYEDELASLPAPERVDRLCELNVIDQVKHVCETTIVRDAWGRGEDLTVHGLVYGLHDGLLRDLGVTVSKAA